MSKVWMVTGSSRGLGLEIVNAAVRAGDRVVATARDPKALSAFAGNDRVRIVPLDVTDPAAASLAVKATVEAFGALDVVVNNAGYANVASIEDGNLDDFRKQFETNFFGVVNVTRAALPILRNQGRGHIIQISSIGGRRGSPGLGSYQSAKWAVEGFSEVLALETKPFGVKVTIVEPGGFRTDWAGASMKIDPITPAYEPTIGAFRAMFRAGKDHMRGDPKKGGDAIVQVAHLAEPPHRIVLGTDALFLARLVEQERMAEDEKWSAISRSTDADGLGDFADSDLAKQLAAMRK